MSSVNRWVIYCHFFGVAVNPRFLLSFRAAKKRRISANMNTIYCHFSRPSKAGKGPFQATDKTNDPRRFTGDKQWITEVRTSIQVSHLYLARPPGEPARRIRMRQTGRRGRCSRYVHLHLPLPPRAAALAPLCGYPMSEHDGVNTTKEE